MTLLILFIVLFVIGVLGLVIYVQQKIIKSLSSIILKKQDAQNDYQKSIKKNQLSLKQKLN